MTGSWYTGGAEGGSWAWERPVGGQVNEEFYASFVAGLARDEWGHPVLPMPERLGTREYESRLLELQAAELDVEFVACVLQRGEFDEGLAVAVARIHHAHRARHRSQHQ